MGFKHNYHNTHTYTNTHTSTTHRITKTHFAHGRVCSSTATSLAVALDDGRVESERRLVGRVHGGSGGVGGGRGARLSVCVRFLELVLVLISSTRMMGDEME